MTTELWRSSAAEITRLVRDKQVSVREVIQAHLDRIDQINDGLNAVTIVLGESALEAADHADEMVSQGVALGPLHGVPITVKENIDLSGSATTNGVVALKDDVPPEDAPHVSQLRPAGAIPIGRTNMPDFGLRYHTDNDLRGPTINPWDVSRTPGGSSGGDGVAIATGMTPIGLGNDLGGSVRYPAQCCGIASIRPTLGRVPRYSSLAPGNPAITMQLFAVQGPMARHVSDLRLALWNMSGPDARDPWHMPVPLEGPPLDAPIKVAVTLDPAGAGVDSAVADGVRRAADVLSNAGYDVAEVEPPSAVEGAQIWSDALFEDVRATTEDMRKIASSDAMKFLDTSLGTKPASDRLTYSQSLGERVRVAREWSLFHQQYPIVLGPVSTEQPFPVGYDLRGAEEITDIMHSMRLVTTVNLLGLPAAVVPVQVVDGLPQAVQIIGQRYREDVCLDAAEAIEREVGVFTPIGPVI